MVQASEGERKRTGPAADLSAGAGLSSSNACVMGGCPREGDRWLITHWWLAKRRSSLRIWQALGHASIETTQTYAKVVDRIRENPTRYLEELMG
jgi:hypothetical protein